jgi:addiction module HigA family antidote
MTQKDLAARMGRPLKTINEIIKGKAAITADTALQLERVLGTPASFWVNLERNYREALARAKDAKQLKGQLAWLKQLPIRAMVKVGWIQGKKRVELLQELLRYFGVASPDQWQALWTGAGVAYRKSRVFASDPGAVAAWLRRGEIAAQDIRCQPFDVARFREALAIIRGLTIQAPERFHAELTKLCTESGVAVVFVRELPGARVSGATRWVSPVKALIQLSLRYKSDDQLWFSFFHEAGHVLLHGKREVFINDGEAQNEKESEASTFAADLLLPPQALKAFLEAGELGEHGIIAFARAQGITPGIVVGRLQFEGVIRYNQYNHLKKRFEWATQPPKAA